MDPFLAMSAATVTAAARVTAPITHLVPMEVIEGLVSMLRNWTAVSVVWIKAVVHVAVKACGAMEPGAGSDKDTAGEPLGSVVPVGSAAVRRIVEIPIRARGRYPDINGDPCRSRAWDTQLATATMTSAKTFQCRISLSPHLKMGEIVTPVCYPARMSTCFAQRAGRHLLYALRAFCRVGAAETNQYLIRRLLNASIRSMKLAGCLCGENG
jgi:hypothetical protein